MSSKNPWDRIFALGKIFSILQGLQEKELSIIGEKLIKGVYSKHIQDLHKVKKEDENMREGVYSRRPDRDPFTDSDEKESERNAFSCSSSSQN